MTIKGFGLSIIVVCVAGVVAVSNASAAATTAAAQWYVNGSSTPLPGVKSINVKTTTVFTLKAAPGGTGITLSSAESSCLECTIVNTPVTEKSGDAAYGTFKVKFGNVTVVKPGGCKVAGGSITTDILHVHADYMNGTTAVWSFLPASKGIRTFATFELEGATCGVTGLYLVQGTLFGNASNATGTFAKEQPINFSQAINTADGGALTISGKPAELEGQNTYSLSTSETFTVK